MSPQRRVLTKDRTLRRGVVNGGRRRRSAANCSSDTANFALFLCKTRMPLFTTPRNRSSQRTVKAEKAKVDDDSTWRQGCSRSGLEMGEEEGVSSIISKPAGTGSLADGDRRASHSRQGPPAQGIPGEPLSMVALGCRSCKGLALCELHGRST
jgi:hypothetical protein